jgi:outer membrane biosynthesis protein TonB
MSDDLDDLLRRSMKTLDDQVPSGYFEGLPTRTLARLEDSSMQTTGTSSSSDPSTGAIVAAAPPVVASAPKDRDEDSGLHDIRSLASSTKLRLSSRRSTQNPVVGEDDVLASSSAGWKAVALPEPAKMVSLPELADLPTKAQVEALDKAAQKKAAKEAKKAPKADRIEVVSAPAAAVAAPSASTSSAPMIGSRIAAQQSGGRGKMIALVGLGLSAAAGLAIFFVVSNKNESKSELSYESKASAPLPEMTAKQLPPPPAVVAADTTAIAAGAAAPAVEPPPAPEPAPDKAAAPKEKPGKVHKVEIRDTVNKDTKPVEKPVVLPKEEVKKGGSGDDGEPSFDALLKEAGVTDQKKAKPKLEKKSLSGGDIKSGMGSVAGKAAKCYAGTQGTASVKLTVAPSGQVEKVKVTGVFAGTPVAACVESAVKSASFPAWDGGPQSFGYSYLLAE